MIEINENEARGLKVTRIGGFVGVLGALTEVALQMAYNQYGEEQSSGLDYREKYGLSKRDLLIQQQRAVKELTTEQARNELASVIGNGTNFRHAMIPVGIQPMTSIQILKMLISHTDCDDAKNIGFRSIKRCAEVKSLLLEDIEILSAEHTRNMAEANGASLSQLEEYDKRIVKLREERGSKVKLPSN